MSFPRPGASFPNQPCVQPIFPTRPGAQPFPTRPGARPFPTRPRSSALPPKPDICNEFDKKFGIPPQDTLQSKGNHRRFFFGVVKWFNPQKEPNGYIVTINYGFDGSKRVESDFIEVPFSRSQCNIGHTPKTRSLVVFSAERINGRLCATSLRDAQFSADDFRLALKYAANGFIKIDGTSKKSANPWTCNIHIMKTLSNDGVLINGNPAEVKKWILSYFQGLPEPKRQMVITSLRTDDDFANLLNQFVESTLRPDSQEEISTQATNNRHGELECEVDVMSQDQFNQSIDNDIVKAAQKSLNNAAQEQLNRMYASKIANRLNELDTPTDYVRRRWIWELIQNAKDSIANKNDKNSVWIHLEINDDTLLFEHNGSPFNSDTVFALQYQYSQDKRNQDESTGRFGTGFMTTHCLSRVVGVKGDFACNQGVCGFSFDLHREGNTYEDIIDCLNKTEQSQQLFHKPFGKTTFTYQISSESAKRAVALGIDEVRKHGCAVMCFCPEIESISVSNNGNLYAVNLESKNDIAEGVSQVTFAINDNGKDIRRAFLLASLREDCNLLSQKYDRPRKARIDAAIEIDEISNSIVECGKDSSVFCVFPVIGAEQQLQEPFLFNSPDFELTTERDALYLSGADSNDNGKPSNVAINKMIFEKSSLLFRMLLDCLIARHANKFYFLTNGLRSIKGHEYLDGDWYKVHVQNEHRRILREAKVIVPSTGGERISLMQSFIVDEPSAERASEIVALMSAFTSGGEVKCPIMDNDEWAKRLWHEDDIQFWNIKILCNYVAGKKNWGNLPFHEGIDRVDWFNHFLAEVQRYEESLLGQLPLIPDMLGGLHTTKDATIEQGVGVDDFVIKLLQRMGSDVRSQLMHLDITGVSLERKFNSSRFSAEIDHLVQNKLQPYARIVLQPSQFKQLLMTVQPLLEVNPIGEKYSESFKKIRIASMEVLKDILSIGGLASTDNPALLESAWQSLDAFIVKKLPEVVASYGNLDNLTKTINVDEPGKTFDILNRFYIWLRMMGASLDEYKIFPNQHGCFMYIRNLYSEQEPLDDRIKDLLACCNDLPLLKGKVNYDFRNLLLDKRCEATPPKSIGRQELYSKLDRLIDQFQDNLKENKLFRDIVRNLLDEWKERNESEFNICFPLVKNRYNELELNIVHNKEERRVANELLRRFSIKQLEDLASGKTLLEDDGKHYASNLPETGTLSLSDAPYRGLSGEEMSEALVEAKEKAKTALEAEGFVLTKGICEDDFTLINGVMKDNLEYPVVVRSYKDESRQFQLSTTDWEQLVKPNSKLLILKRDGQIYSVNFRELIAKREKIDLSFSTHNLDIGERIGQLATVLRWFEGLKFDFDKLTASSAGVAESFDLPEQGIPEGQRDHELSPDNPLEVF